MENINSNSCQRRQPPTSAFAVANWFLGKAEEQNKQLTIARLQDFVYLAYGWYYAYYDEPLFDDVIFATWRGPAVATLATLFQGNSKKPINHRIKIFQDDKVEVWEPSVYLTQNETNNNNEERKTIEKKIESVLAMVWDGYSELSHSQLLLILYRSTSPLGKICKNCEYFSRKVHNMPVDPEKIGEYFTELLDEYTEELQKN
jgi:uncharacterized phage-associated protein